MKHSPSEAESTLSKLRNYSKAIYKNSTHPKGLSPCLQEPYPKADKSISILKLHESVV